MITLAQLTELLGWAAIINIAYLILASVMIMTMKGKISSIHKKMFNIDDKDVDALYFNFLGNYKVVTLVIFVAPYFALKIMGY